MPGRVAWLMASDIRARLRRNAKHPDHSAADTEGDYAGQHHGCVIPGQKSAPQMHRGHQVLYASAITLSAMARIWPPDGRHRRPADLPVKTSVTGPAESGECLK